jgi:hypothetical protein
MESTEKLATYRVHIMKKNKTQTQHYMCWTRQTKNNQIT